jgi:hypothetical protein
MPLPPPYKSLSVIGGLVVIMLALDPRFAVKNPSPTPVFEPAKLGFIGNHTNHQTTESD